jgi:type VI secretion system protein ImpH
MAGENGTAADDLAARRAARAAATGEAAPADGAGTAEPRTAPAPDEPPAPSAPPSPPGKPARERAQAMAQLFDMVGRAPGQFDFFQVLRRLEVLYRDRPERPRFGTALRPADEPIRLGQEPELTFAPSPLGGMRPGYDGGPPRLVVNFFGLFGPNGPLPLHLTEYARDRLRNADDPTMSRFADVFHHRMLMLFYRAWASGQPTVSHDDPLVDRFVQYVGTLIGLGLPALQRRDDFPDPAKFFYAGRLGAQSRNADGLQAMIGDFFQMPARVEPFVGDWLALPVEHRWQLGVPARGGLLGVSTTIGGNVWGRQQKFRVVLGPLERSQFQNMLPGGSSLKKMTALVRTYVGDEMRWDLRLILKEQVEHPWHLGVSRLGWTSWAGRAARSGGARREDLVLDPQIENHRAAAV